MSLFVKICGMTSTEAVEAAVDAGADAVGFVFAHSTRQLTPERAVEMAEAAPSSIEKVAVFLSPELEEIRSVLEVFPADTVQADRASLRGFRERPTLPVLRGAPTEVPPGRFLFEGPRSGVGETADWLVAEQLARQGDMVLAGGLRSGNVADALTSVRPFGVDVSSGVESAPGIKSPVLIEEFVMAARAIDKELMNQ